MSCGIIQRQSCWYTDWLAILKFGWNNIRVCILTSIMFSKFPFSESACTILNTAALDVQQAKQEMEKKLHDRGRNIARAACMVRGKDEVNKVMAARDQVCPSPSLVQLFCCSARYALTAVNSREVVRTCSHLQA